jgi:hypothetical protein
MYEAWKAIVDCVGDVAQVNLLLNRVSSWTDVLSHLPYEGKVILRSKTARKVRVRLPKWVDKRAVRCRVNQGDISTPLESMEWLANYLTVGNIAPGDEVVIEFPVVETTEHWTETTYETTYTCQFRGNTLVDISPRGDRPALTRTKSDDGLVFEVAAGYPIYMRDHYGASDAPVKDTTLYVAPALI